MSLFVAQVRALMKKDFLVVRKHKRAMIMEFIFPVIMACLASLLLTLFTNLSKTSDNIEEYGGWVIPSNCFINYLYFVPPSAKDLAHYGQCYVYSIKTEDNVTAMISQYEEDNQYPYNTYIGAVWENETLTAYHKGLGVGAVYSLVQIMYPFFNEYDAKLVKRGTDQLYGTNMKQMFATIASMLACIAFLPMLSAMSGRLVDEKRAKIREHLRVMGVGPWAYLMGAFGTSSIRVTFVTLAMLIAFLAFQALPVINIFLAWLILELFGFSLCAFAQLMPCFFSRSSFSNGVVSLFLTCGAVGAPWITLFPNAAQVPFAIFFSPVAAVFAMASNLGGFTCTIPMTVEYSLLCLIFQVFFYFCLSQYIYAIHPGEYGVPLHPMFPIHFLQSLCGFRKGSGHNQRNALYNEELSDRVVLESLYKYYGSQRVSAAVDNLSLNIKGKEIFALLGHNGAGKTTTISMLTGMLASTGYGTANVLGYDLNGGIDEIRKRIGSCPQFDVLFDDLSGLQHLELYAAIKGRGVDRATSILNQLKLPTTDQKASTYSGGMKRRLSVACAIVGDSPLLFLDEPSSGLDPLSRRQLWDMLKAEKEMGKTLILTTHFMEEADYLGDRIAIMSHGRLYCCGTSEELKETYGVGYYLTLAKQSAEDNDEREERKGGVFNVAAATEIVARHCDGAVLHRETMGDATWLLPMKTFDQFGDMLLEVEDTLPKIGASSYGIAMNTLEDVFVTISEKEKPASPANAVPCDTVTLPMGDLVEDIFQDVSETQNECVRVFYEILAVMHKKALYLKRWKRMWFLGLFVPCVFVVIGFLSLIPQGGNGDDYNYSWQQANGMPDMLHQHLFYYERNETFAQDVDAFVSAMSSLYPEMVADLDPKLTGATLEFTKVEISAFLLGSFIDTHSIAFTSHANVALALGFQKAALLPKSIMQNGGQPEVQVVSWSSYNQYGNSYYMFMDMMTQAAADYIVKTEGGKKPIPANWTVPKYRPVLFPEVNRSTPAPTTMAPTTAPPTQPPKNKKNDGYPMYMVQPLGVLIVLAVTQYAANAALQVADELHRGVFPTMRMHGLSALGYWIGTLLFDMFISFVLIILVVAGTYIRPVHQFQNGFMSLMLLSIFLFCANTLLCAYAILAFAPPNLKQSTIVAIIVGFVSLELTIPLLISIIYLNKGEDIPNWNAVMFPARALFDVFMFSWKDSEDAWSQNVTPGIVASLAGWCAAPILVLIYYSYFMTTNCCRSTSIDNPEGVNSVSPLLGGGSGEIDDIDVAKEKARVLANPADNMACTLKLRKVFKDVSNQKDAQGKQKMFASKVDKVAVKEVTFGVRQGECFGLLGPNGAGKTTSVLMLLRQIAPTCGQIQFPYSTMPINLCLPNLDDIYRYCRMGVCHQHDTLWEHLTAEEHLQIYLKMRLGSRYKSQDWQQYIANAIQKVYLEDAGTKTVAQYSGGMKRKLAVCIAMYTGAKTVFLDEPSTGMDPYARRALWKSINEALQQNRCVLLTTHSMEEADAVCSRISIMTNGTMKCIGSSQHLKSRFGAGYTIVLHLAPVKGGVVDSPTTATEGGIEMRVEVNSSEFFDQIEEANRKQGEAVDQEMIKMFGTDCTLIESVGQSRSYALPKLSSVARAFKTLSTNCHAWGVTNYSVNQVASLDQIFVQFAGTSAYEDEN